MTKKIICLLVVMCMLPQLGAVTWASEADKEAEPRLWNTYTGQFDVELTVPRRTVTAGMEFTVEAWTLDVTFEYRIQYNSQTGEMGDAVYISYEDFGAATNPGIYPQAQITSLNGVHFTTIEKGPGEFKVKVDATANGVYSYRLSVDGFPRVSLTETVTGKTGTITIVPAKMAAGEG